MPFKNVDRRLRNRYKARLPLTLKNNGQEIHGVTRNISLLGVSAFSFSPSSQFQPVQCLLHLPHQVQPLIVHGTVIRSEPLSAPHPDGTHETGIFFKGFERGGEETLSKFLHQILDEEHAAIQAGYQSLKQRAAARLRRKQQEVKRKNKRRKERFQRKQLRLKKAPPRASARGHPRKNPSSSRKHA